MTKPAIILHQFEISPFCDKVRRILHVKGLAYSIDEIRVSQAGRVRRLSPAGKLPAMSYDGVVVADSTTIADFLEERHPDPPLTPADPAQAGLMRILEDWADEALYFLELTMRLTWDTNAPHVMPRLLAAEPAFLRAALSRPVKTALQGVSRTQGVGRKPRDAFLQDLDHLLDSLAALLNGRDWLVGEKLSRADIAVFAQLACIRETQEGGPRITQRLGLANWMARVDAATAPRN